ncbi:MAG: hypothetical protein Q8O14_14765 [bacterium]|nr:hypothetical protein [bacterium]
MSYPLMETDPPKTAVELRWCPACGRAIACVGRYNETYEQLRHRADAEWIAAQAPADGLLRPTTALDGLGPTHRRVLGAICLMGPQRSATRGLSLVTRLSTTQVVNALAALQAMGIIGRTSWSTPPAEGTELPATWWPMPAHHDVLGLAMDIADLTGAVDLHLRTLGQPAATAIPQTERTPA